MPLSTLFLLLAVFFVSPKFAQGILLYSSLLHPSLSTTFTSTASVSIATSALPTTTSSNVVVGITGIASTGVQPSTASWNSTALQATNIQPCNGYVELCDRKLSNVSLVVAHNSPFVVPHNAASNQNVDVLTQLNDGIRGLQFQTHYPNSTSSELHLCHTSCNLLNAGPLSTYLSLISTWLAENPNEVLAIMMGNDARVPPSTYIAPFERAGLLPYLYIPPKPNLTLAEWPTLSEMIHLNKRVIVSLDYLANQTEVPWLLDEFAYTWQTPFSPTNPAFPCTQHRPPGQTDDVSRDKMYMLNHNLNIHFELFGTDILIPAYTLFDEVNAVSGDGSLGLNVERCTDMWGRPPNWLLVDYYDVGDVVGSIFRVAATANGVRYSSAGCCGKRVTNGASATSGAERFGGHLGWVWFLLAGVFGWRFWSS